MAVIFKIEINRSNTVHLARGFVPVFYQRISSVPVPSQAVCINAIEVLRYIRNHILDGGIAVRICLLFMLLSMKQAFLIVANAKANLSRRKVYSALLLRGL